MRALTWLNVSHSHLDAVAVTHLVAAIVLHGFLDFSVTFFLCFCRNPAYIA
jgi:hypothetical protein